jgi:hypothetical protein
MGVNSDVKRPALHSPLSNEEFRANWKCNATPTCDCGVQRQFYLLFIYLFVYLFIYSFIHLFVVYLKSLSGNSANKFRFPIVADK